MPLYPLLIVAGLVWIAAGMIAERMAWPRLRALAARGLIALDVPPYDERGARPFAWMKLVWSTPIPEDRVSLRRLLLVLRLTQIGLIVLMAGALFAASRELDA